MVANKVKKYERVNGRRAEFIKCFMWFLKPHSIEKLEQTKLVSLRDTSSIERSHHLT